MSTANLLNWKKWALLGLIVGASHVGWAQDQMDPNAIPTDEYSSAVEAQDDESLQLMLEQTPDGTLDPLYNPCWRNPTGSSLCRARNFCSVGRAHPKCQYYCSNYPNDRVCWGRGDRDGRDGRWDRGFCRRHPSHPQCRR